MRAKNHPVIEQPVLQEKEQMKVNIHVCPGLQGKEHKKPMVTIFLSTQELGFTLKSARFAASTSGAYEDTVPWYERLCVDCPLSGVSKIDLA